VVKIFPGSSVGGPDFVSGVKGPMSWASLMPTGGVSPDEENLAGWFKAGVHCVGLGSQLFPQDIIESGNYSIVTDKCSQTLAIIRKLRT
jgi:2-dehydro-3-deoxyphosphogluconate aldolase/(4S)-4-hydroxy-2-oxoglutarate aldolase